MELRPFVPGRHHPRFHVIPEAIERDVDRTDLLAGPAARAFPRVPRELLARLHMAAEQQIQRPAHLVLPEREDPTAGRGAFPARFLVCGADGDAVAAHRARVDIFLNGRHLCEASHPIPPTVQARKSASWRSAWTAWPSSSFARSSRRVRAAPAAWAADARKRTAEWRSVSDAISQAFAKAISFSNA